MPANRVQVAIRTRPTDNFPRDKLNVDSKNKTIKIHVSKDTSGYVNNKLEDWAFKFHKVLHNVDQEMMYDECADDIVNYVLQGYNGTIMAYGQTGAGKTFTMMGGTQNYKYRGIAPRTVAHVFRHVHANPQVAITVQISYLEIYNEQFFDLLEDSTRLQDLAVMNDANGTVIVKGLSKKVATSEEEALNLLFEGETNRAIAEHQMNKNSTRSHCVFTMHLDIRSRIESSEKVVRSKLNLVDLAGSERVKNTGSSGKTLREANYINKSLTFLEQVVIALSSKARDHIPFRQSKLTNVLRDSLGGNCKTRLIANVWTEATHLHETVSTLKFATRMMRVANDAVINERQDPALMLKKCQRQIRELKQELAMHDSLANRSNVQYDDFTPEQRQEAYGQVEAYMKGSLTEIKIVNVRQIQELFRQFKYFMQKNGGNISNTPPSTSHGGAKEIKGSGGGEAEVKQGSNAGAEGYVGEYDAGGGGFHLGEAEDHAAPPQVAGSARKPPEEKGSQNKLSSPKAPKSPVAPSKRSETKAAPSEAEAFEDYKTKEGFHDSQLFEENKKEYQAKKLELKTLSGEVNKLKGLIDKLSVELAELRSAQEIQPKPLAGPDDIPVIDEQEFSLIRSLKGKKKAYQGAFHKRKMLKNEVSYMKGLVKQSKLKLCSNFLEWYREKYSGSSGQAKVGGAVQEMGEKGAEDDVLDDGEQFDKLEKQRIMEEDPDSLAFFNARKTMMATLKKKKARR